MFMVQEFHIKYEDIDFYMQVKDNRIIVLNTESGVWKMYDKEDIEIVESSFSKTTLRKMKDDGLLERAIQLSSIEGTEEFTLLILEMTKSCNLKCEYCFENAGIEKSEFMTREIAIKAFELFSDISCSKRIKVEFNGGEALLNFEVIKAVIPAFEEIAKRKNINVSFSIQTNGTLITDEMVDYMKDNNISLGISVDGQGEYNRYRRYENGKSIDDDLKRSFARLKAKGKNFSTLSVVSSKGQYASIVDLQRELGHCECRANLLNRLGRGEKYAVNVEKTKELAAEFIDFAKQVVFSKPKIYESNLLYYLMGLVQYNPFMCYKTPCGSGKNQLYVDSTGKIYACQESCYINEGYLGDVSDSCAVLKKALETNKWIGNMSAYKDDMLCHGCEWRKLCHLCPVAVKKENAMCEFNKIVLPQLLWLFAEQKDCIMNYIQYK